MPQLIVNPGTKNVWEIPLHPGTNSLGRDPENDFCVADSSVSGAHCVVTVTGSAVVIKDIGSINGTLVDGALIDETPLKDGQTVQLGSVIMQFKSETAAVSAQAETVFCINHRQILARYFCPKCHRAFCEACVNIRRGRFFCRACGVECVKSVGSEVELESEQTFTSHVRGAFAYPLKGDGLILLFGGTIVFLLIDGAKFVSRFAFGYGFLALVILTVFGTGYLTCYLRRILTSSAIGEEAMPDWPEITDISNDILSPFFQLAGTVSFCFAPAIGLTIYAMFASEGGPWLGWATTACMLFGSTYFPLAFTAVAMFDSVAAVNPLLIIPSILKIPKEYLLTIVLFIIILMVRWMNQNFLPELIPVPILPSVLAGFVSLYLLTVEMRILGLLYWVKKDELGWFSR